MTLDELERPGPARAAALGAIARELRFGLSVCGDRGRVLSAVILDRALAAAKSTQA